MYTSVEVVSSTLEVLKVLQTGFLSFGFSDFSSQKKEVTRLMLVNQLSR